MSVTMRQMLEAGVHFGHQTRFWNPKMAPYIFGHRNKIHIINLEKTLAQFQDAARYVKQLSANRGTVLFVGTKRSSREVIAEEAQRCGMPFVDQRWLGGMLTNFKTVKGSIKRLKDMETVLSEGGIERMPKKEGLLFQREYDKLVRSLGGIKDMAGMPDAIFVIDVGYHKIAVTEANKLGIPVIGIVDTNHAPEGIDYIIPGNDDASRAVRLYARGLADVILEGRSAALAEIAKHADDEEEFVKSTNLRKQFKFFNDRKSGALPPIFLTGAQRMAEITASMVKALREKTDAPMMECKKALAEAEGDLAKAEEILRVKLGSKASKAASRTAAEGVVAVYISDDRKLGAIVELNSETDFVAKNDDFVGFSLELAKLVAEQSPADVQALSALQTSHGVSVESHRAALVGKIGENMNIRRFQRLQAQGHLASYIHGGSKIGVVVDLIGADESLAKDLAMHIAASKPKSLDRSGVPEELIDAERRVATEKAAESGKPAEIVAKMVEGSVQKFLKEVTLLGQIFVKDDKVTIEQLLKQRQASVPSFVLYVVGEGMEKKANDFAAEVAAQAAAAAAAR